MRKTLTSIAVYLTANAIGLLVAMIIIPEFGITIMAFLVAVLIFTGVQAIAAPLLTKMSTKYAPQLNGGISLIAIFVGLLVTSWIVSGISIGGISNLLAATFLVWLGSLAAGLLLPVVLRKYGMERHSKS